MKLYLMRHSEAAPMGGPTGRPLTSHGAFVAKKVAAYLVRLNQFRVSEIYHSGKLRAEQTATIFSNALDDEADMKTCEGLCPDDDPARIIDWLEAEDRNIAIVSHLPFLPRLSSLLVGGANRRVSFDFPATAVLCLEHSSGGPWSVTWHLTPELIG